jgi:hypothetical protein
MIPRTLLQTAYLTLLLTAAGCAPRPRPSAIVDRSQDDRIRREVEARLVNEPSVDASRIRVVVNGGEVQLQGAVRGLGALQCAMTNAQLVRGVRLVIDLLVLERGPTTVQCLAPRPVQPAVTGAVRGR